MRASSPRTPGGPGSGDPLRLQIMVAICALHERERVWPSPKAVAEMLHLSKSLLVYHRRLLVAAGYIERLHGSRVVRVTESGLDHLAGLGYIEQIPISARTDDHIIEHVLFALTERGRALIAPPGGGAEDLPGEATP